MRFGTRNVLSLYRTGAVTLVAQELAKYRLGLVGEQKVRLHGNGISPTGDYMLYYRKYLGRYLGLRKTLLQENGESYVMLSYMHCILHQT